MKKVTLFWMKMKYKDEFARNANHLIFHTRSYWFQLLVIHTDIHELEWGIKYDQFRWSADSDADADADVDLQWLNNWGYM